MESRIARLFLGMMGLTVTAMNTYAAEAPLLETEPLIVTPDVARTTVNIARVDAEDFEFSVFGGLMSIEDFGVNGVWGGRLAYHVTSPLFVEIAVGFTKASTTSYERLSGSAALLTETQRKITYYNLSVGYALFPGEAFWSSKRVFTNDFYLIAGVGNTTFADDAHFTINLGAGYRILFNDKFAAHLTVREHLFSFDLLGEKRTLRNFETALSATFFF